MKIHSNQVYMQIMFIRLVQNIQIFKFGTYPDILSCTKFNAIAFQAINSIRCFPLKYDLMS